MLALALAAAVCGPAHAPTLAASDEARVYARAGVVEACDGDRTTKLGARADFLDAYVAGRRLALLRRAAEGHELLTTYDLRSGRRKDRWDLRGTFAAVKIDHRGLVVFFAQPAGETPFISSSRETWSERVPGVDPSTFVLGGGTIAWRTGATYQVRGLLGSGRRAPVPLLRIGDVRLTVRPRGVYGQVGGSPARRLGQALDECRSSSGCGGIDVLQAAGHYLAVGETYNSAGNGYSRMTVRNLATGATRVPCSGRGANSFVVTDQGLVACATSEEGTLRIRSESAILDEGPGIDPDSLTRRGDQLVWRHDGVERFAPLPTAFG